MKDPFLSRRKRPNQPKKLKFVCSFNGAFQPRPPSGNLRYTGGDTRIVSVERNIGFSRLKSKISELLLLCHNNDPSFSLKYQLSAVGDDGAPLVMIASDGDVRCMIDDCEKLESHGKRTRLWIFVCNDNDYIYKHRTLNSDVSVNCVDTGNLYDDGFKSRNSTTSPCGSDYFSRKVKSSAMGVNGVQCSDDSLRKIVLKQLLLAKQSAQIQSFRGGSGLSFERSETEITSENQKYDQTVECLTSEPQGPGSHETPDLKFCGNQFRANVLDHEFRKPQLQRRGNLGMNPLPLSNSHPLNPRDGNPFMKTKGSMQCLTNRNSSISGNGAVTDPGGSSQLVAAVQFQEQSCDVNAMRIGTCGKNDVKSVQHSSLSKLDRDNNTPWSAICDLVNSRLVGGFYPTKSSSSDRVGYGLHSGIRHHCFAATNTRNQRTCSYHIRNHRNSNTDMGIHRNVKLEGRPWVGKFYPGLRSSSNISKHGQAMRLYCPCCWKAWPDNQDHTLDEIGKLMDYGLMNQNQSPYGIKEKFKDKGGRGVSQPPRPNADEGHFAYNGASASMGDQFFLQTNHTLTNTKGMEALEHLSTSSTGQNDEVPCQAPSKTFDRVPMCKPSSWDIKESHFIKPAEYISIAGSPNNLGLRNGGELGCSGKLSNTESDIKSFSNHHNISQAIQGGVASSVNLSLDNLSLSSSKEVDSPTHYSPTSNDISKPLLKSQSKPVDLMDEESLTSGPQVGTSNGVASDSSSQNEAKLEKVEERKEEMQQDYQSNLCIDEKADIKECQMCVKPIGTIPSDLAAFYAHLASRELQTIKSSDLEYIKELGSGTYGTVFYGKWKGCDVAIKKLKPSCFNEGAPEQDRLVADFWKEAHILGQLHHPHIVAFYGVVTDGPVTNLATVTEYMVNGSLKQVLQRKDRTIDRRKRLIIAMDAAFGMEYLHEKNIVHFDLKSHNLLVNMRDPQRPVCKIGDLGLSKIKQRTLVSGGVRGTIPWMAPELLNITKNMVTEKVDVYSFGIVMWELLTGEEPYGKMRSEEIIAGIIKGNLRPEIPSWCDPAWRSLMERCWSSDPVSRPSFSEIAKELRAMSVAMNIK